MIGCITGTYAGRERDGSLIVAVGGVGYIVTVDDRNVAIIAARGRGEHCALFTRVVYAEKSQTMYGFADEDDRDLFDDLVEVDGIGPGTAIKALSMLSASEFHKDLASGGKLIIKTPGIGAKTLDRIRAAFEAS